jgi:iron complex transport system ATP-binding protein
MNEHLIQLKDIHLRRQGNEILRGIDLTMTDQQHLAIIGPNGAGKSFLLQILSADLIPSSGTTTILGKTFGQTNLWALRQSIGFISNRMLSWMQPKISVFEVVASGWFGTYGLADELSADQKQAVDQQLNEFELIELKDRSFASLSDGERRKALFARAMVKQPQFLILDEPCQGLDIPSREHLIKDIDALANTLPLVYVTHHLEELPLCITHVMLLKAGQVFAYGTPTEILTSERLSDLFDYDLSVEYTAGRWRVNH